MDAFNVCASMNLVDAFSGPLRMMVGGMNSAKNGAMGLADSAGQLAMKLAPIALLAVAISAAFLPAIGTAADFESSMSNLAAISRAGAQEMDEMRQSALDLGASTAFSAVQVASAQTELAKKGVSI
ncbi:MAG: phage tail tape measure protein [Desulfovibrio sp.]